MHLTQVDPGSYLQLGEKEWWWDFSEIIDYSGHFKMPTRKIQILFWWFAPAKRGQEDVEKAIGLRVVGIFLPVRCLLPPSNLTNKNPRIQAPLKVMLFYAIHTTSLVYTEPFFVFFSRRMLPIARGRHVYQAVYLEVWHKISGLWYGQKTFCQHLRVSKPTRLAWDQRGEASSWALDTEPRITKRGKVKLETPKWTTLFPSTLFNI